MYLHICAWVQSYDCLLAFQHLRHDDDGNLCGLVYVLCSSGALSLEQPGASCTNFVYAQKSCHQMTADVAVNPLQKGVPQVHMWWNFSFFHSRLLFSLFAWAVAHVCLYSLSYWNCPAWGRGQDRVLFSYMCAKFHCNDCGVLRKCTWIHAYARFHPLHFFQIYFCIRRFPSKVLVWNPCLFIWGSWSSVR